MTNLDDIAMLDLFAAGGGWDEGALMAGVKDSYGIELDKSASATARAAGHKREIADITTLDPHHTTFSRYNYIHASPVCTTFSAQGRGSGRRDLVKLVNLIESATPSTVDELVANFDCEDPRTALTLEPLRWVNAINPDYITMEQVTQVMPVWEAYAEYLTAQGYSVWFGPLQAEQFGVPQTRRRAILMASKVSKVSPPAPTHSKYHRRDPGRLDDGVLPWVTFAEAMGPGWVPDMRNNNGTQDDWPFKRPCTTVTGSFRPDIIRGPGWRKAGDGPSQNAPGGVYVTPAEAGVLQSFPADYPWRGSVTEQFRQIGNAVPPLLAKVVVESLLATHDRV